MFPNPRPYFEYVSDPREDTPGKRHKLGDIFFSVINAVLNESNKKMMHIGAKYFSKRNRHFSHWFQHELLRGIFHLAVCMVFIVVIYEKPWSYKKFCPIIRESHAAIAYSARSIACAICIGAIALLGWWYTRVGGWTVTKKAYEKKPWQDDWG
jgi:hypothetical protein